MSPTDINSPPSHLPNYLPTNNPTAAATYTTQPPTSTSLPAPPRLTVSNGLPPPDPDPDPESLVASGRPPPLVDVVGLCTGLSDCTNVGVGCATGGGTGGGRSLAGGGGGGSSTGGRDLAVSDDAMVRELLHLEREEGGTVVSVIVLTAVLVLGCRDGHSSGTRLPRWAWPRTEADEASTPSQTSTTRDWTSAMPATQAGEQALPEVKSRVVQPERGDE